MTAAKCSSLAPLLLLNNPNDRLLNAFLLIIAGYNSSQLIGPLLKGIPALGIQAEQSIPVQQLVALHYFQTYGRRY